MYLFGGRGKDNRTRGSMYILEVGPVCFTQLKTTHAPESRDGHTCVHHDGKLVLYGGCEGGEEDMTLFSKVHLLDLGTRVWSEVQALGLAPPGRDGHAAAQVGEVMVVYGGSTNAGICSDILGFHLPTATWHSYLVEGDLPGCRESMGCTVLGRSLYIFGGNTSANPATDLYSNALYRLDVNSRTVESLLVQPLTELPSARLSCSLSAVSPHTLVMFGGEGVEGMLNDIWAFYLNLGIWREIVPTKSIESRIAHIGVALEGKLVVFGGLGDSGSALNEVAVLSFKPTAENSHEAALSHTSKGSNRPKLCSTCGHFPSFCESDRYNSLSFPCFSHCSNQLFPMKMAECAAELNSDPVQSLLRVLRPLSKGNISLKCLPGLFPIENSEDSLLFPQSKDGFDPTFLIILQSNAPFSPDEIAAIVNGAGSNNLLMDLLTLSNVLLLLSRSEDFITLSLVSCQGSSDWVKRHVVVLTKALKLLYPCVEIAKSVFALIYREFRLARQELMSIPQGFQLHFHSTSIFPQLNETFISSQNTHISLSSLLAGYFYAPSPVSISLNGSPLPSEPASSLPIYTQKRTPKCLYRSLQVEDSWPYELRIYSGNCLDYVKVKEQERAGKHGREAGKLPCDLVYREGGKGGERWERGMETLDLMREEGEDEVGGVVESR